MYHDNKRQNNKGVVMDCLAITKKAKELQHKKLELAELRKLFGLDGNMKSTIQYNPALEYIKRKIILQYQLDMVSLVNGIHPYDQIKQGEEQAYENTKTWQSSIQNKINDTDSLLVFSEAEGQFLFANDLGIKSPEDREAFKTLLYQDRQKEKQIVLDDMIKEETFKYDYDQSHHPLYKLTHFLKYRNLTNRKEIESPQNSLIRNYIQNRIKETTGKLSSGLLHTEVRALINKGIAQYESNEELLSLANITISSLSNYGEKVDIREASQAMAREMRKELPDKVLDGMKEGYRTEEVMMGDEHFHEETFKPISFDQIEDKMNQLQEEYEQLYDNPAISDEEYLQGVAKIYADMLYTQPFSYGNKRISMAILNEMILSKKMIPPYISTVVDNDFTKGLSQTKVNNYEKLSEALIDSYRKMNENKNDQKIEDEETTMDYPDSFTK